MVGLLCEGDPVSSGDIEVDERKLAVLREIDDFSKKILEGNLVSADALEKLLNYANSLKELVGSDQLEPGEAKELLGFISYLLTQESSVADKSELNPKVSA